MRISDWSSDVCSADLPSPRAFCSQCAQIVPSAVAAMCGVSAQLTTIDAPTAIVCGVHCHCPAVSKLVYCSSCRVLSKGLIQLNSRRPSGASDMSGCAAPAPAGRSEEHTSELQSLMRISYAVFCLKKKKKHNRVTMNEINNE